MQITWNSTDETVFTLVTAPVRNRNKYNEVHVGV